MRRWHSLIHFPLTLHAWSLSHTRVKTSTLIRLDPLLYSLIRFPVNKLSVHICVRLRASVCTWKRRLISERGSSGNRYGPTLILRKKRTLIKQARNELFFPGGCCEDWGLKPRSDATSQWTALKRSISLIIKPNNELSWIIKRRRRIRRAHTSYSC